MKKLLLALIILLLLISVLPHLITNFWVADLFVHFKVQYLALLIPAGLLAAYIRMKKWVLIMIGLLICWNLYFIFPLINFLTDVNDPGENDLKVLSINLLSDNTNFDAVGASIIQHSPDVLFLLEYNDSWATGLENRLSEYPYRHEVPRRDNFGIAVFSKYPVECVTLTWDGLPPLIRANLQYREQEWTMFAVHTFPPVGQERFRRRNEQLNRLASFIEEHIDKNAPVILGGDLNTSSCSAHFRRFMENADMVDSRNGWGIQATWPVGFLPGMTTLDHFLVRNVMVTNREIGPDIGSDHLPVLLQARLVSDRPIDK